MLFFNPDTSHTTDVYDQGQFTLIWKLSLTACFIFACASGLYITIDGVVFTLYLMMFLTASFSVYYLKKYKKSKPIFWLFSIISTAILFFSIHNLNNVPHYNDIIWTACLILFTFIGLKFKFAIAFVTVHSFSLVLFYIYSLNVNADSILIMPKYQLWVYSLESFFAFALFVMLMHHYLKYQKFTRADLDKTRSKYQSIIENINEALIQDDKNGKIVFWNNNFLKMFEYDESEMTEKYISEIINPEYHENIMNNHFERMQGDRNQDEIRYMGKSKKGKIIWIEINATPLFENGKIIGTQSLIRDVTSKREQEIQLNEISQELIKIAEDERERIAYNIHDGLNQLLVATKLNIEIGSTKEKLTELINSAISESKSITQNLVPKDIKEFGLKAALTLLTEKVEESSNLSINLKFTTQYDFSCFSEHVQFNIYRIIQEALNNTLKYANASNQKIEFSSVNNNLRIVIWNDGECIPKEKINNPSFLISIKRRINILKGNFEMTFNEDNNVSFLIELPIQ